MKISAISLVLLVALAPASLSISVYAQSTNLGIISGTVRCGGGCDTLGLAYGDPIRSSGRIFAFMTVALDPYTNDPRPDIPTTNAQTTFDASAQGKYELQGLQPGVYDLWASANGYQQTLVASGLAVHLGDNLHLDGYICPNGAQCSSPPTVEQTSSMLVTASSQSTAPAYTTEALSSSGVPTTSQSSAVESTSGQPLTVGFSTSDIAKILVGIAALITLAVVLYPRAKKRSS